MTAATQPQQKDVFGINLFVGNHVVDRVLNILLCVFGSASLVAIIGIVFSVFSTKIGKQEIEIVFFCKGKHVVDLIKTVKAPSVKSYQKWAVGR